MAENENGQEKTEEPTPRKLQKAKDDGQIARSKELNTTFVLVGGVLGLISFGGDLAEALKNVMRYNFSLDRAAAFDEQMMVAHLAATAYSAIQALTPFMLILAVAAFVGNILLGGWMLSGKALMPKFSRLNLIKGMGRLFSANSLVELTKSLAKFLLVASITALVLNFYQGELLNLGVSSIQEAVPHAIEVVSYSVLAISATTIFIAVFDVPYQLYSHKKKLKMTLQEVKDEMKDSEGKPEVKSRIRQLQREVAQRRMMAEVPNADVVITNPEHFSVALRYDLEGSGAPVVVAKGTDQIALKIREIAVAHEVMMMEAPPLARAIYFTTELDEEIPGQLYMAVAQVLAYVFQLKAYRKGEGAKPKPMADIDVPDDVHYGVDGKIIRPDKPET
ncbi:flagellar biosynthesis protein FlhB [Dasania sp. GY-MA-18]|uniref:Flagellar biosynthetic protein FlhB n=1 Tax=Dasania phycosphaerae TaxID=2950436 RepID=A0A9J6RI20_9GAMM|nr:MULTISPECIES: flagellar biosynthesis protein FlhB [Dasania]MCR8921671.1 flagellar biosynthesis protein FlhB [Dasania sp. GY-MA-18]MCZ0864099.1 flagellar biosynthesis protein FlhB [Dasania phycosphaerae]MCZ0867827.1 flagellar biosynthesis protein FlhB [Dasania phycosphaerae]